MKIRYIAIVLACSVMVGCAKHSTDVATTTAPNGPSSDAVFKFAQQGNADAQYNLALMYLKGLGVKQNSPKAVRLFQLAAKQGDVDAQNGLGVLYFIDEGMAPNAVQAYMWLSLAATAGNAKSADMRDRVASNMTAQQIAQAQQLAMQCQTSRFTQCD